MSEKILEINDMYFSYGEIKAVKGITLSVGSKEIVTLIGGNGAGKTTTLCAISGLLGDADQGEILFMGEKINKVKPHKIAAMGVVQCLEGRHIFSQLTVRENLMMGAYLRKGSEIKNDLEYVFNLFPRLLEREKQLGGTLSGGEQQMLAVGRALMQKPKILMMDEPSLGLAPLVVQDIFKTIKKINQDGMPILLVEQNSNAALKVANRGYVIETGNIVLQDSAENLLNNEEVKKSYLGIQ
jgi:ABC-type branched-chain amino acid transport systems, ATPase component